MSLSDKIKEKTFELICICLILTGFCFPWIMSLKNIFLSAACSLILISLDWFLVYQEAKKNLFILSSLLLLLSIAMACLYSQADYARSFSILGKYRRLLYPLVLVPFFSFKKSRLYLIHGLFSSHTLLLIFACIQYYKLFPSYFKSSYLAFPFINPIYGGFIIAISSYLSLIWALNSKNKVYYYFTFISGTFIIFFLQHERVAYYSYLLLIGAVIIQFLSKKNIKVFTFIGLILMCCVILSPNVQKRSLMLVKQFNTYLQEDKYSYSSIGERLELMKNGWSFIKEKPLLGWGTGSFASLYAKNKFLYLNKTSNLSNHLANPHNQFLLFFVELGILGLSIFCIWLLSFWYTIFKEEKSINIKHGYSIIALSLIGAFCIACFTDVILFLSIPGDFCMLIFSWLIAESKDKTKLLLKLES